MKKIFEYLDYQEYLRDFYASHKQENPYFSYRYMGRRLSLDPGFLAPLGITQHLTPNRRNALSKVWERIRQFAEAHAK